MTEPIFYHYTTWSDVYVGQTFHVDFKPSQYWESRRDPLKSPNVDLSVLGSPELEKVLKDYRYRAELLKEYVFEEIRRAEHPEAPSRRSCLFALDPDVHAQTAKKMGIGDRLLLQLTPAGEYTVHKAAFPLLDCNTRTLEIIEERARKYWTEPPQDPAETEVLLTGCFTITDVIPALPPSARQHR